MLLKRRKKEEKKEEEVVEVVEVVVKERETEIDRGATKRRRSRINDVLPSS